PPRGDRAVRPAGPRPPPPDPRGSGQPTTAGAPPAAVPAEGPADRIGARKDGPAANRDPSRHVPLIGLPAPRSFARLPGTPHPRAPGPAVGKGERVGGGRRPGPIILALPHSDLARAAP